MELPFYAALKRRSSTIMSFFVLREGSGIPY